MTPLLLQQGLKGLGKKKLGLAGLWNSEPLKSTKFDAAALIFGSYWDYLGGFEVNKGKSDFLTDFLCSSASETAIPATFKKLYGTTLMTP